MADQTSQAAVEVVVVGDPNACMAQVAVEIIVPYVEETPEWINEFIVAS